MRGESQSTQTLTMAGVAAGDWFLITKFSVGAALPHPLPSNRQSGVVHKSSQARSRRALPARSISSRASLDSPTH
jgi:hypothetical protein